MLQLIIDSCVPGVWNVASPGERQQLVHDARLTCSLLYQLKCVSCHKGNKYAISVETFIKISIKQNRASSVVLLADVGFASITVPIGGVSLASIVLKSADEQSGQRQDRNTRMAGLKSNLWSFSLKKAVMIECVMNFCVVKKLFSAIVNYWDIFYLSLLVLIHFKPSLYTTNPHSPNPVNKTQYVTTFTYKSFSIIMITHPPIKSIVYKLDPDSLKPLYDTVALCLTYSVCALKPTELRRTGNSGNRTRLLGLGRTSTIVNHRTHRNYQLQQIPRLSQHIFTEPETPSPRLSKKKNFSL